MVPRECLACAVHRKRGWVVSLLLLVGAQLTIYQFYKHSSSLLLPGDSGLTGSGHRVVTAGRETLVNLTNITNDGGRLSFVLNSHWISNQTNLNCVIPNFRSWEEGMVTRIGEPIRHNCQRLRTNSTSESDMLHLTSGVKSWKTARPWEGFASRYKTLSCTEIRREFSNLFYVSETEKDFPIAYVLVVYTNVGQMLRFLQSIYRPHNLYCIHPDARQGHGFADYFQAVARCVHNIFVVFKPVEVYYAHISILDAQLNCMQDLVEYPDSSWKYVINLTGREVPLKTNREIVGHLKELNGYSAINMAEMTSGTWKNRFIYEYTVDESGTIKKTANVLPDPPEGIQLLKSSTFLALSRDFVHFLFNDHLSVEFRKFLSGVRSGEEHFYASLYVLPQAKGGRPPAVRDDRIPLINEALWMWTPSVSKCPGGQVVHHVCILTAAEMGIVEERRLRRDQPVFFFNKYFLELDPTPMDCAEEQLVRTNIEEYLSDCDTAVWNQ